MSQNKMDRIISNLLKAKQASENALVQLGLNKEYQAKSPEFEDLYEKKLRETIVQTACLINSALQYRLGDKANVKASLETLKNE